MALDHFVSQVYFKNFYSKETPPLHAIRKYNIQAFNCHAKDVCRLDEGSTNRYFEDTRIIEDFLKFIEPKYNGAIENLSQGKIKADTIFVIAGWIAYVFTCSPTAIRLNTSFLYHPTMQIIKILEGKNLLPKNSIEGMPDNLTECLQQGIIELKIDPQFSQSIGISNILNTTNLLGNSKWEILICEHNDCLFFTSDFPIALEESSDPRIIHKIVPLSPKLALRIIPNITKQNDWSFSYNAFAIKNCTRHEAIEINKLIVKSAEDYLFYNESYDWIEKFVKKYRNYRIELKYESIPAGRKSTYMIQQLCITPYTYHSQTSSHDFGKL